MIVRREKKWGDLLLLSDDGRTLASLRTDGKVFLDRGMFGTEEVDGSAKDVIAALMLEKEALGMVAR